MDYIEKIIYSDPVLTSRMYKYVDDVLCLWCGTERQLSGFLNRINSIDNNIQFTMETAVQGNINFLD